MRKRLLDLVGSATALIVLSPLIGLLALAVRLSLGSPVIFRQSRGGINGTPFTIYKFRTMLESEADGPLASDAERMTRFGRFLRQSSLDELPQFWNVLRGDMSLVGPRPLLLEYTALYTAEQARRLLVRPGITSIVAVKGRNAMSWERQLQLDVWYVNHWTMALDLKILSLTLAAVIKREGANQPGRATRDAFRGNVG